MPFEVNDKVKVVLHEPVGNATTETANCYLRPFVDREGWVLQRKYQPDNRYTYRVGFKPKAGKYCDYGVFHEYELTAFTYPNDNDPED